MDQFDQAQELDAIFRKQALAAHAKAAALVGESRENCLDCDEPIPDKRRKLIPGCMRCIACATMFEAENKMR